MNEVQIAILFFCYYPMFDLKGALECEVCKRRVYLAANLGDGKKSND